MMEGRTGQHKTIHQRYGNAQINSGPQRAQHAAGLRSVDVKLVVSARVARRYHIRLAIDGETSVADEAFIKNLIDGFAIVYTALG